MCLFYGNIYMSFNNFNYSLLWIHSRSSCFQMFCKIRALKNSATFKEKHLCWSLFLIKAWGLQLYLKRNSDKGVFQWIWEILKDTFLRKQLWATASLDLSARFWSNSRKYFLACSFLILTLSHYPANIYLFKVNNRNTRKRCKICSKLQ